MKKLLMFIFVFPLIYSCYCQDIIPTGHYQSPYFSTINSEYIFSSDTFQTYIPYAHMRYTVKGTYKIIGDKIHFYPISPEVFKKSQVIYEKEESVIQRNNFWFVVHCRNKKHQSLEYLVRFLHENSLDGAFLTLRSNGDSLNVTFFDSAHISHITISSSPEFLEKSHEDLDLEFDDKFLGNHYYNISLAEDSNTYFKPNNYSLNIFNRSSKGFFLSNSIDTVEYRKSDLCTDEFLRRNFKQKFENYKYYMDLEDHWLMLDQLIKSR